MFSKLKSPDSFYGWVNLVVMFLFNIALYPMMFMFMLCLPVWDVEFGWGRGDITLAQSISLILSGLTAPMVGIYIMKKGPRIAIVIGNLISVVALVLLSFQQQIWHLELVPWHNCAPSDRPHRLTRAPEMSSDGYPTSTRSPRLTLPILAR